MYEWDKGQWRPIGPSAQIYPVRHIFVHNLIEVHPCSNELHTDTYPCIWCIPLDSKRIKLIITAEFITA